MTDAERQYRSVLHDVRNDVLAVWSLCYMRGHTDVLDNLTSIESIITEFLVQGVETP